MFDFAPDPHFDLYARFHSSRIPPGGYNWDYFNNSSVDALLDQAVLELNQTRRSELYHQVDQLLVENAAAGFVWEETKIVVTGAWLHGMTMNPCLVETYNFYDMYLVQEEKP
jgi:peptide/nickel transport system substrate-binding protein